MGLEEVGYFEKDNYPCAYYIIRAFPQGVIMTTLPKLRMRTKYAGSQLHRVVLLQM